MIKINKTDINSFKSKKCSFKPLRYLRRTFVLDGIKRDEKTIRKIEVENRTEKTPTSLKQKNFPFQRSFQHQIIFYTSS